MQAKDEVKVLENVQQLVEECYVDGRPRHHLPAAHNPATTTDSIFFVSSLQDYNKLSEEEIQDIFSLRHIIVTDIPTREYPWNQETLSKLGSLQQQREIQGEDLC